MPESNGTTHNTGRNAPRAPVTIGEISSPQNREYETTGKWPRRAVCRFLCSADELRSSHPPFQTVTTVQRQHLQPFPAHMSSTCSRFGDTRGLKRYRLHAGAVEVVPRFVPTELGCHLQRSLQLHKVAWSRRPTYHSKVAGSLKSLCRQALVTSSSVQQRTIGCWVGGANTSKLGTPFPWQLSGPMSFKDGVACHRPPNKQKLVGKLCCTFRHTCTGALK